MTTASKTARKTGREDAAPGNRDTGKRDTKKRDTDTAKLDAAKARLAAVAGSRPEAELEDAILTLARSIGWSEHSTRLVLYAMARKSKMGQAELAEATEKLRRAVCRPFDAAPDFAC